MKYGYFEYNIIFFGLKNTSIIFQHSINDVYYEFLDDFIIYYLYILFYSKNTKELEIHICCLLQKLKDVRLYTKVPKCIFYTT